MIVRRILAEDIDAVMAGAFRMHAEGIHQHMDFAPDKVRGVLELAVNSQTWACFVAREGETHFTMGPLLGAILGYCMEATFSRELIAGEVGVYVLPEKRGGFAAKRLIEAFEAWAIERGAREITLGVTVGINDVADRLYPALGFRRMGGLYMKTVP